MTMTGTKGGRGRRNSMIMNIMASIVFVAFIIVMAGCGEGEKNASTRASNEKVVLDLCKYMSKQSGDSFSRVAEEIMVFLRSEENMAKYLTFYEVMTSAGVPGNVAMAELAKVVFRVEVSPPKSVKDVMTAYDDTVIDDVETLKSECRRMRDILAKGGVTDRRIARYLFGFLIASPEDRRQIGKDCANFVQVYGVIMDFVRETVREAEDADIIFTDGSLDEKLRVEIKRRGLTLEPWSMIKSSAPKKTPSRDVYIEKMTNGAAAQLGLELVKRAELQTTPRISGTLFRLGRMSDSVRVKGIEFAKKLAARILDIHEKKVFDSIRDAEVKDLFLFVQWRLARIARLRAEYDNREGKTDRSLEEIRLSDELDEKNPSLKRILEGMARLREKTGNVMSPKEGLQFALVRADFRLARKYAEPILKTDPDDPNANFGMGMWYFMQEQFDSAEKYLTRCLKKNAKEPAVWNNLAVLQLRAGRLDEAMKNAQKALSLAPSSDDIKDTIKQIEESIGKKKKGE